MISCAPSIAKGCFSNYIISDNFSEKRKNLGFSKNTSDQKNFKVSIKSEKYKKDNKKNNIFKLSVFGPGGGFLGVGSSELIVIGVVAWLVLGPKRLYQLAKDIGKITSEVKNVAEEARTTFQQAIDVEALSSVEKENSSKSEPAKKTPTKSSSKKIDIDEVFDSEIKKL